MRKAAWMVLAVVLLGTLGVAQDSYVVGCDIAWPPFEWVSARGDYMGFDLDVMRSIAILEGFEIEIRDIAFDSIIPGVIAGRVDIGASGFTITDERAQVVTFSEPYWTSDQAVVVRVDTELNIVTAMSGGSRVGAQRGTTGAAWVEDELEGRGVDVRLVLYETYPEAIMDLIAGRLDAVVQDQAPSEQAVDSYPDQLRIAGTINTEEQFGFLVALNDPQGLLPRINAGMEAMKASGAWGDLVTAYFGPTLDAVETAWVQCIDILKADEDVDGYARCLTERANE